MTRVKTRTFLRRLLPLALFVLGCFPSRGLYFLLHPATPDGRYHAHQPVLSAPSSPTPRLKPAKVPLPARLTRIPRTLKRAPIVAAPALVSLFAFTADPAALRAIASGPDSVRSQSPPASPPPSRAPPAAA